MPPREVAISRADLKKAENQVAVDVHRLYFAVLIAELQKRAAEEQIAYAKQELKENTEGVRNGSLLRVSSIQGDVDVLQGQQAVLTADLQATDLNTELDDLLGLPLDTKLDLQPIEAVGPDKRPLEEYVQAAWANNPEIASAEESIKKARAAVASAKSAFIPDITAYASDTWQNGVPFIVTNFGTVGVRLNYDVFDFGKRRAAVREREAQLAEAEENLKRLKDSISAQVERNYNALERTKNLVAVADQVVALRRESERLSKNQVTEGVVTVANTLEAASATYKSQVDLLQANLNYMLAWAELETDHWPDPRPLGPSLLWFRFRRHRAFAACRNDSRSGGTHAARYSPSKSTAGRHSRARSIAPEIAGVPAPRPATPGIRASEACRSAARRSLHPPPPYCPYQSSEIATACRPTGDSTCDQPPGIPALLDGNLGDARQCVALLIE